MSGCGCGSCSCGAQVSKETVEVQDVLLRVWSGSVTSGAPEAVMTLYMDNAILQTPALSALLDTPPARASYFNLLVAKEDLEISFDDLRTRVFGDVAVNSGHLTYSYTVDGATVTETERFTFVYKKTMIGWMIVEHHASRVVA